MHDDPVIEHPMEAYVAKCQLHAVLVRVFGTGVLLIGESGIGKSESALDLLTRGHQLVADDAVEALIENGKPVGRAPDITRDLLEIRGLGILNVAEIFGAHALCKESPVDLCIELRRWTEAERLGDVVSEYPIVGVNVPQFILPVSPGRNLATLVETAVRIHRNGGMVRTSEKLVEDHSRLLRSV